METHREELADEIVNSLARRHSTATVLFHHALAERLGLGPTDHKCLDLLHDRGPMTGSQLAALAGLTTGAITGVVSRLERSGWLTRERHAHDRRKQVLRPTAQAVEEVQAVFRSLPVDNDALLEGFDTDELTAIREFLLRATDHVTGRAAALRVQALTGPSARESLPPAQEGRP